MSKSRSKRSPIWLMPFEDFKALVERSKTIGEVLAAFNMRDHGSNFQTLRRRFEADKIDYSKFKNNCKKGRFRHLCPLEEILVEGSKFSRRSLKKRILKLGLVDNKCCICDQPPIWCGKPLILVLDHINGVNDDNRIDNLRMLCPNCNSQTETFAGRNLKTNRCSKDKFNSI